MIKIFTDMKDDLLKTLKNTKKKLRYCRDIIAIKDKVLNRLRFSINDNIYRLGDYCAKNLCCDSFKHAYAFRLIQDIESEQNAYDRIAKTISTYRDLEIMLLEHIEYLCKKLGIENV